MIEEYTARMVCKSDIELKNGIPVPPEPANNGEISLINRLICWSWRTKPWLFANRKI